MWESTKPNKKYTYYNKKPKRLMSKIKTKKERIVEMLESKKKTTLTVSSDLENVGYNKGIDTAIRLIKVLK
jgi:hypothetical protein